MTTLARSIALLLIFFVTSTGSAEPPTKGSQTLYIQPLGKQLPDADVEAVKQALEVFFGLKVVLLPRVALPKHAYYKPRRRYRAWKLVKYLAKRMPKDGHRILGLTGVDISTTKGRYYDWGVLGLAALDGSACVISSFRCRKKARSAKHARIRLAKVAVHEIGHTLGLEHCPTVGCLLEDARGKVATCDREYDICPKCRARLRRAGHTYVPARPEIPWPKP